MAISPRLAMRIREMGRWGCGILTVALIPRSNNHVEVYALSLVLCLSLSRASKQSP